MDYCETYNRNRVTWLYEATRDKRLSAKALRVGMLFATFLQPEGREESRPTYAQMMEWAHVGSRTTLAQCLRELEDAGYLEIIREENCRNTYALPFTGEKLWMGGVQKMDT